jgi:hypothetical protein
MGRGNASDFSENPLRHRTSLPIATTNGSKRSRTRGALKVDDQMEQTNVIGFPAQPPESERLRLYQDHPAIVLVLAPVRAPIAIASPRRLRFDGVYGASVQHSAEQAAEARRVADHFACV